MRFVIARPARASVVGELVVIREPVSAISDCSSASNSESCVVAKAETSTAWSVEVILTFSEDYIGVSWERVIGNLMACWD